MTHSFSINNKCDGTDYTSGSIIYFDLTVTTERNVVSGPMSIEMAIPDEASAATLTYVSGKIVSKGKNNLCSNMGSIPVLFSNW